MNRNFENRKPTKVYAKSKENQMIIKAINMFGRVPETWELCLEIERLNNIINKAIEYIRIYRSYQKIDNKDYLKGRDEIGCLDIYQVDELLDILNEVSE